MFAQGKREMSALADVKYRRHIFRYAAYIVDNYYVDKYYLGGYGWGDPYEVMPTHYNQ